MKLSQMANTSAASQKKVLSSPFFTLMTDDKGIERVDASQKSRFVVLLLFLVGDDF